MGGHPLGRRGIRSAGAIVLVAALAACSLPEPDGLEADLMAEAEGLAPLRPGEGRNPGDVARNGLLLSPEVRAAAAEVSASADAVRIERAGLFPQLGLSLGGGVGGGASDRAGVELRGSQLVYDFGRTDRAVTAADIDMQIDYLTFQEAIDDALVETLTAYDAVLTNVRLLDVRRAQVAALQELEKRVAERVNGGAAPRSDLLETQINVRAARFAVVDTELELGEARDRLAELTGQSRGGEVTAPPVGKCVASDVDEPVLIAQLRLARAEVDLVDAEAARTPSVTVEPVVRRREGDGGVRAGLDVAVNSDLIQGGALSAAVDAAKDARDAARADVAAAERETLLEGQRKLREIEAAERRTALLRGQIALLDEARTLYRTQYLDLGTRRIAELLDNEEEFYNRQAELIEVRSELLAERLACAVREDRLRAALSIEDTTLYGLPIGVRPR